jgi:hypothetical protein
MALLGFRTPANRVSVLEYGSATSMRMISRLTWRSYRRCDRKNHPDHIDLPRSIVKKSAAFG